MKKCPKCKQDKDDSCFYKNIQRKSGLDCYCKECQSKKKDNRKERGLSPAVQKYQKEYRKQHYIDNREYYILRGYKEQDRLKGLTCEITVEWIKDNITNKSCTYCGTTINIGCDRIDNSKGHTKDNCIPCCTICNTVRNRNFSVTEMLKLGLTIKEIYKERLNGSHDHR